MGPRLLASLENTFRLANPSAGLDLTCPLAKISDEHEREQALKKYCAMLVLAVREEHHFQACDEILSTLLPNAVRSHPVNTSDAPEQELVQQRESIRRTEDLISRLPSAPGRCFDLPLFEKPENLNSMAYMLGGALGLSPDHAWVTKYLLPAGRPKPRPEGVKALDHLKDTMDLAWRYMWVTYYMDTTSTLLAWSVAEKQLQPDQKYAEALATYVNLLCELLQQFLKLSELATYQDRSPFHRGDELDAMLTSALWPEDLAAPVRKKQRIVVDTFLWTAWHRSATLLLYYVVGAQVRNGVQQDWARLLAIRGPAKLDDLHESGGPSAGIRYVCQWAFEMLRTHRSALTQDISHLCLRIKNHFGSHEGRCVHDTRLVDLVAGVSTCQRFTDAESKSQTVHTGACKGKCGRMAWNEESFHRVQGAKAVDLDNCSSMLEYTTADSQTLAFSHVWSHGQGGRPEIGINSCLHRRYCRLAKALGCRSYWIDAACIPSERVARQTAIGTINDVFNKCKATLIMDMDLQSVSIDELSDRDVEIAETLVSILLVCDWSVRAWTMLEAMRGSRSLYVLCADERVMSVHNLLSIVLDRGSISLAVLLGGAQHLLPSPQTIHKAAEESATLLSRRHASKPLDEIVIWGLLCGLTVPRDAAHFWQLQSRVRTAFLISSAARVERHENHPTLGWAPTTPYARPRFRDVELTADVRQRYSVCFPAYDGEGSAFVTITPHGLLGRWRYLTIDRQKLEDMGELEIDEHGILEGCSLYDAAGEEVDPEQAGVMPFVDPDNAYARHLMMRLLDEGAAVRYLRPVAEDGIKPYVGSANRGDSIGLIGAVCASFDDGVTWRWQSVHRSAEPDDGDGWEISEMTLI